MGEQTPSAPPDQDEPATVGALAHRINNALSYVVTNLNLLTEELEGLRLSPEERARLLQLVDEAYEGSERAGDLVRRLKVLSWGNRRTDSVSDEDTWDSVGNARILVIDDEPHILAAVKRALRSYDVVTAETGQRGVELLQSEGEFDLVLCDLLMKDVGGMDLYEWVRANKPNVLDRIVFMTGGAFTAQLRGFLSRIRNAVLHKPFDTKTLRWMVSQKLRELSVQAAKR